MSRSTVVFAILLAIAAIVLKLVNPALPENFSLFYALALFCGCFLRGPIAFALPIGAILISDVAGHFIDDYQLGMYGLLAMTLNYIGFALMTGLGILLRKNSSLYWVAGASIVGAAVFFVVSNFGAFLDPRMGHPNTFVGLMKCYSDAIPFARGTFSSSLLLSLASFAAYGAWMSAYAPRRENVFAEEARR